MRINMMLRVCVCAAALFAAGQSLAADSGDYKPEGKGVFMIDLRVSDVIPEANDPIVTAAGAATGLSARVGDSVMPTLGFTYFFTNNLSVEAILGATHHTVYAEAPGSSTKVHSTWVLPPVITLQYRPLPKARVSPYVGVGANAMVYFSGEDYNGFTVKLRDEFGYAVQTGLDIAVHGPWFVNLDAKKVFTNTRANIDNGALYAHVGLSPWVASVGVGRKF